MGPVEGGENCRCTLISSHGKQIPVRDCFVRSTDLTGEHSRTLLIQITRSEQVSVDLLVSIQSTS
jgi:hypothetical protein